MRKGDAERRSANLNDIVELSLPLALIGAQEMDIATNVALAPDSRSVSVDPVQIQQVILNLVRNAVDAVGEVERRRLAIETRCN